MYALATRITFICPMKFNAFPMDVQRCKFQVSSSRKSEKCRKSENSGNSKNLAIQKILQI
jgi:hypothetical protein